MSCIRSFENFKVPVILIIILIIIITSSMMVLKKCRSGVRFDPRLEFGQSRWPGVRFDPCLEFGLGFYFRVQLISSAYVKLSRR